jgi:hypothetical protein
MKLSPMYMYSFFTIIHEPNYHKEHIVPIIVKKSWEEVVNNRLPREICKRYVKENDYLLVHS